MSSIEKAVVRRAADFGRTVDVGLLAETMRFLGLAPSAGIVSRAGVDDALAGFPPGAVGSLPSMLTRRPERTLRDMADVESCSASASSTASSSSDRSASRRRSKRPLVMIAPSSRVAASAMRRSSAAGEKSSSAPASGIGAANVDKGDEECIVGLLCKDETAD